VGSGRRLYVGRAYAFSVLVIVLATFCVRASNNMLATSIPLLTRYVFDFSGLQVGLASALFSVSTFLMSAYINTKLTSHVRRNLFVGSTLVYALTFPLFYFSSEYSIWPLVFLAGFVLGAVMPNIITSAGLFPDRRIRERVLAIYTFTLSASLIAGPAIDSAVLRFFTLRESFLFFTIFPAILFIASFFIRFPESEDTGPTTKVWRNPGFRVSVYNILAYNIPFGVILTFGGIFARDSFHASYSLITLLFSLFFATSLLGRLLLTIRTPENLWRLMSVSVALTVVGLTVLGVSHSLYGYALSLLILGLPHGLTYPLSLLTLSRSFDERTRSAANSYFFSIMMASGAIMPFVAGALVELIGIQYSFIAIIPPVGALYYLLKREMGRKTSIPAEPRP